jgi:DnaJ-class molecular chaperone
MERDLYEILGVQRTASADEIRRAHRKLVREHHPDVSKAKDAAATFAAIQEAYDILSDPEKRARYDQFGMAGVKAGAAGAPPGTDADGNPFGGSPFGGQGSWQNVDPATFEEIFGGMFGGTGRGKRKGGGFGGSGGGAPREPEQERGGDLNVTETIDFTTAARGGTRSFRLGHTDQTVDVRIPAGVEDGAKLAVRGKGAPGSAGGPAGDLIITLRVAPHPWLRREGSDLLMDVPLGIAEAALGASITVPLLEGSVSIRVPGGVRSGQKIRVKGKGIAPAKGTAGDFYAVLQVQAPRDLGAEQRELLQKLGDSLPSVRTGAPWE